MQDVQMLRLEIDRTLNFLSLDRLKMAAKYVASLYKGTYNKEAELETPVTQMYDGNHQTSTLFDNRATKADWEAWFDKRDTLFEKILERRNGKPVDISGIWDAVEADWEEHDKRILSP